MIEGLCNSPEDTDLPDILHNVLLCYLHNRPPFRNAARCFGVNWFVQYTLHNASLLKKCKEIVEARSAPCRMIWIL